MWIQLSDEQVALLRKLAEYSGLADHPDVIAAGDILTERLNQYSLGDSVCPRYREAAQNLNIMRDGECEVDEDAVVSSSDEGAYVMAWVWVDREDAGFTDGDEE